MGDLCLTPVLVEQHPVAGVEFRGQRGRGDDPPEQGDGPEGEIDLEAAGVLRHVGRVIYAENRVGTDRIPVHDQDVAEVLQPRVIGGVGLEVLNDQDHVVVGQGVDGAAGGQAKEDGRLVQLLPQELLDIGGVVLRQILARRSP